MKKLALDFAQHLRLVAVMDEGTRDLIIRLATQVGMIMEDASPTALLLRGRTDVEIRAAISTLTKASAQITSLVAAMTTLAVE